MVSFLKRLIPARWRPIGYLLHLTRTRSAGRVRSGPLLGIYERELAAEVESICQRNSGLIVDVGAAEGYYAVGLAVRNPQAKVIAFEMEPKGQAALREMSALNQVTKRVEVRGKCEPADLVAALGNTAYPVVICDVEGYEARLLDPQLVPALARARILVELHDFIVPGITEVLQKRFSETHRIKQIWQEPRSRAEFPWRTIGTTLMPKSYLDWSVSEWRPVRMAWLWMEPHG